MSSKYDAAVIGGGLTGLSAAYYLSRNGGRVLLIEKDDVLGGLSSSWDMGKYFIERYYHHISSNDKFLVNLLGELNIGDKLKWEKASVGYFYDDRIYGMDTPLDILRFSGLNLIDVLRLGTVILRVKLKGDYSELDNIPAEKWIIKNAGGRVYENFFKPLLNSKFGENSNKVSAAWLFGRIKFRSSRSLSGEKLGYMEHGFQDFIDKLRVEIIRNKGTILTNTRLKEMKTDGGRISSLLTDEGEIETVNTDVISTVSPPELLGVCKFPDGFRRKLEAINYQKTVCATLVLNRAIMEGIYWLNIKSDEIPFGALIEHTNFHRIPEYGDDYLAYVVSYIHDESDPLWGMGDEGLIESFSRGIREINPDFKKSWIKDYRIIRGEYTAPVYDLGYYDRINAIESPFNNLLITGMFMSYPERSMNESLRLGYEISREVG